MIPEEEDACYIYSRRGKPSALQWESALSPRQGQARGEAAGGHSASTQHGHCQRGSKRKNEGASKDQRKRGTGSRWGEEALSFSRY